MCPPLFKAVLLLGTGLLLLFGLSEAIDCYVCGPDARHPGLPHSVHNISCIGPLGDWAVTDCKDRVFTCETSVKKEGGGEVISRGCGTPGTQLDVEEECSDTGVDKKHCHCSKDFCNDKILSLDSGVSFLHGGNTLHLVLGGILGLLAMQFWRDSVE